MSALGRTAMVIIRKEVRGGIRDRRPLLSTLVFPLLGPLTLLFTYSTISDLVADESPLSIPITGSAPAELVTFLEGSGAEVHVFDGDAKTALNNEEVEVVLRVPDGFGSAIWGETATHLEIISDQSRAKSRVLAWRVRVLLRRYAREIISARLTAHGLSPALTTPFAVTVSNVTPDHSPLAEGLSMMGAFLLLAAYTGGMYLAIDITIGERERGSLEALLSTQAPRVAIVLGKSAAIACFAFASLLLSLTLFYLAMALLPMDKLGLAIDLTPSTYLVCVLVMSPWVLTASVLQHMVATMARSLKEAQMFLSLLMLAPTAPAIFFIMSPSPNAVWPTLIPGLAQQTQLSDYLTKATIPAMELGVSLGIAAALTVGCLWYSCRLLRRERVIFGA